MVGITLCAALLAVVSGGGAGKREPGHLAFVLVGSAELPDPAKVIAAFRDIAPEGEAAVALAEPGPEAQQFSVGKEGSLIVALMPAPVPKGEAEEHHRFSFSARLGGGKLAPHRAHLIALFRDEPGRSRYDELVRFTYLLAALAEASRASAIYWGDADATHEARFFVAAARARDPGLMVPLWTGVELAGDGPDRVSLLSLGMRRQLGIMELRVTAPRAKVRETYGRMYDLLAYVARRGAAIPEGDTVGSSEEERLKVRYERSPADRKQEVWRVDFP
jgi:hypothetical protein